MTRVKRGKIKNKKRKKLLKQTKGFKWGRKSKKRQAKEALIHKLSHQFRGRKEKKRNFRRKWQTEINTKLKETGINYSQFINLLNKENIALNRKVLAELAQNHPKIFTQILELAKNNK